MTAKTDWVAGEPVTHTKLNTLGAEVNTVAASVSGKEVTSNRGAANGYAPLDSSQLVPAINLPSYVDDVLEFADLGSFPGTGVTGKIYVALDTNKTYRWSGSTYVEISSSPGSTDAVPEGAANLYYTNARADGRITAASATGTGNMVRANSPTLVTPALGTPSAVNLANGTNLPAAGLAATGTKNSTTFLRGDNTWDVPPGGISASSADILTNKTINGADNAVTGLVPSTALAATGTASGTTFLRGDGVWDVPAGSGSGDASTNTSVSVVNEIALFQNTAGKTLKRSTGTGLAVLTSGVLSTTTAPSGALVGTTDAQTLSSKTIGDTLNLTSQANTTPTTPAAGTCKLYARTGISGLDSVAYINTLGIPIVMGRDVCFFGRNQTGSTITKGSVVYISGVAGSVPLITKAQATAAMTALPAAGVVVGDIAQNTNGLIMITGTINGVNTAAFTGGNTLYVSGATAGGIVDARPAHPNPIQPIGECLMAHATTGAILVNCSEINPNNQDGTNLASWAIGDGTGSGAKTVQFKNSFTGTLSWTPTAARTLTLPDATDTLVGRATTDTLTNKRVTARVATVASSATPTFATDTSDQCEMLTLATNITSATFSGTPTNAQTLTLVFKSASAQTIALGSSVVAGPAPLLAATVAGKYHEVLLKYNSTAAKWVTMASDATGYS